MQAGCPHPLELLGSIPGEMTLERRLHRHFWGLRTLSNGEWFELRGRLLALLEKLNLIEVVYPGDPKYPKMARGIFWDVWTDQQLDDSITHFEAVPLPPVTPRWFPEIDPPNVLCGRPL